MNQVDSPPDKDTEQVGRDSDKEYAATHEYKFRYDMENAPRGVTLLILTNPGGKCLLGMVTGRPDRDKDICGWAKYPGRDREEEVRRGLFSHNYKPTPDES